MWAEGDGDDMAAEERPHNGDRRKQNSTPWSIKGSGIANSRIKSKR